MARDRYLDDLAKVPLFAECTKSDLRQIARIMTELEIKQGQDLMTEGGVAGSFVIIEDGYAEVLRGGDRISLVGPGDFVGELSLILRRPPNATVRATTEMVVHVADRAGFSQLLDEPGMARRMLEVVARRLVDGSTAIA